MDFKRVDAEKQVFAEGPFGHHGLQIAIGRTDDADVDVEELVFAHPPNLARLQKPQQHDLHAFVQVADFVQEQRAAVGHFHEPFSRRVGPGEGPFAVSEEFAFDQVFRQRPAVHGHERAVDPQAQLVNAAGDEFLAGARFALNHHGRIGRRDFVDERLHPSHRGRFADQAGAAFHAFELPFQRHSFAGEGQLFAHPLEHVGDLEELARFGQKVVGAAAEGLDGLFHAAVARADDDFGVGGGFLDVIDDVPAAEAGHAEIDDGHVEGLLVESGDGRGPVFADRRVVPHAGQLDLHHVPNGGFIVDEQDA